MERTYYKMERKNRVKLYFEVTELTDKLNNLIGEAIKGGITPDVSISLLVPYSQPVIRVNFFRDGDATQNE